MSAQFLRVQCELFPGRVVSYVCTNHHGRLEGKADSRWVVPVGGGFGKVSSSGGSNWGLRRMPFYNLGEGQATNWTLSVSAVSLPKHLTVGCAKENMSYMKRPKHIRHRTRGLLLFLSLLVASFPAALGQEPPSEKPVTGKPETIAPAETVEPAPGPGPEKRQGLAEERKRISAAAAAFGTDPTAINGYYELTYGHAAFTNNLRLDTATAEVRLPITPNWILRVTMPYAWADLDGPGGFTKNGASDLVVRTGGRLYASPNVALFVGADATFPTARKTTGTGKYTLDGRALPSVGPGAIVVLCCGPRLLLHRRRSKPGRYPLHTG